MKTSLLDDVKLLFFLVIFSLVLGLLDSVNYLSLPKTLAQSITTPIQFGLYKTGQSFFKQFEFIVLSRRAAQENKALTEQVAVILSENANLRRKLAETEGFLEQEKSLSPQTYNLTPARPIGISRFLKIDKGLNDKLKVSQPVVYKDNFLGVIKNIAGNQSEVLLTNDPDSKISAFAQNKNGKARGVLIGEFGSEMLLDKILHQESIEKGDLIYTEGIEENLPRGLVLGQVSEVLERENEVFKQAKVNSIFDISNLDIVFVITN